MSSESRDYLYGCLLAVAENIENYVLSQILNEHRITNAERFKRRFTNQPYDTWLIIEDRLTPYMNRLQNSSNEKHRKFLFKRKRLLDEIHTRFPGDYRDNSRLSPDYLFGYYTQREQLFSKKTEEVNHDADTQD